ncbi:MAG TPA: 1-deoxy-D-xylulose-5-phosphate reductoisomerase [Chthoniobacteraceae bacterium]|nr:1-deoxy-D-xylulose-5-phosphate reductoisomerase [Chthoniobacteraceae bacterium]
MKKLVVLGATGSIGQSAAKVARDIPERVRIVGLSAHGNGRLLAEMAGEFTDAALCVTDPEALAAFPEALRKERRFFEGEEGLIDLATLPEAEMVLIAIVGTGGLRPALAAIEAGKDLAIASKEILVMAGGIVMEAARRKGVNILPVDSEHNAIFQCLEGARRRPASELTRLILTASGGPFRQTASGRLPQVTPAEALKHPTWSMGAKITIDSATLFNKGLEMIEARWLFDVEMGRVDVIVHPQSIVHSMVEFADGSILAQLSHSDMCFPIQYAVTWPERVPNTLRPLDFAALGRLEFEAPRYDVFPALDLARQAGETGGTLPAVLNAANEVAVEAFLGGRLSFPGIWETVAATMGQHRSIADPSLNDIVVADQEARRCAAEAVSRS